MICLCPICACVVLYPEIPGMDPPSLEAVKLNPDAPWTVTCNWLGPLHEGRAVLIDRLFRTDGASIPRFAWPLIGHPFQVPLLPYALEHDALYVARYLSRKATDRRFYASMTGDGYISRCKAGTIYNAVHLFGGSAFNRHTEESIGEARKHIRLIGEEEYFSIVRHNTEQPEPPKGKHK